MENLGVYNILVAPTKTDPRYIPGWDYFLWIGFCVPKEGCVRKLAGFSFLECCLDEIRL